LSIVSAVSVSIVYGSFNHQVYYPSLEAAKKAVVDGEAWGAVHIKPKFSSALVDLALEGMDVTIDTVQHSQLDIRLDMTSNFPPKSSSSYLVYSNPFFHQ
jgi:hypothetical protein